MQEEPTQDGVPRRGSGVDPDDDLPLGVARPEGVLDRGTKGAVVTVWGDRQNALVVDELRLGGRGEDDGHALGNPLARAEGSRPANAAPAADPRALRREPGPG